MCRSKSICVLHLGPYFIGGVYIQIHLWIINIQIYIFYLYQVTQNVDRIVKLSSDDIWVLCTPCAFVGVY
jgi:hypothetical protein